MTSLAITIDTEEEGLWSGQYRRYGNSVKNIDHLPKLQAIFNRYDVIPTYLVDYPVATNPRSIEILKFILSEQKCELGAHLHSWCNPPFFEDEYRGFHNIHYNYEIQEKKLSILVEAIMENFGVKPLSYRSGRWQFSIVTLRVLEKLGFLVDTSITPLWKWGKNMNISHYSAPRHPYFLSRNNICKPGNSKILEIPVSITFNKNIPEFLEKLIVKAPDNIHLMGFLKTFGLKRIWLRPSILTLEEMKFAAKYMIQEGGNILNIMFHSSEIMPGASPYNQTDKDVQEFMDRLEAFLNYAIGEMGIKSATLIGYRNSFASSQKKSE